MAVYRMAQRLRTFGNLSPSSPCFPRRKMSVEPHAVATRLRDSGLLTSQGLVGGKWMDAYDGKTIQVQNPATGDVITSVPCMGRSETADAIMSAHNTFNCMEAKF